MKILKSSLIIKDTCTSCHSILEIEPQDVQINACGHPFSEYYTCPICKNINSLEGKIPSNWNPLIYKNEDH